MVIATWVLGRHFLANEQSEFITSRKTTGNVCYQSKKLNFSSKNSNFGKLESTAVSFKDSQILAFSNEIGNYINVYEFCYCIKCVNI